MAKFKLWPPVPAEEELNLALKEVPGGVAVVVMEAGAAVQTLLAFCDDGIYLWSLVETFAARKKLKIDSCGRIVVHGQ